MAPGLFLLLRMKLRTVTNRFDQASREAPIKLVTSLVFIALIWVGLYALFDGTLSFVRQRVLEGIVAVPLVFQFFFVALAVMLAFSNAIIAYGGLFGGPEAAWLLSAPLGSRQVVTLKYLESLFFASWSLLLLGLPLMAAMARTAVAPWPFYIFFMSFFLLFVPIPAAIGLAAAWVVARCFPQARVRILTILGAVLVAGGFLYGYRAAHNAETTASLWLKAFFNEMSLMQSALLPNQWISEGIAAAAEGRYRIAGFYLFVLGANALFFAWLAIEFVSRYLTPAYAAAQGSSGRRIAGERGPGPLTRFAEAPFFWLPERMRLLARKDVRCFLRDPVQWAQMAILLGLLAIYVTNVSRMRVGFVDSPDWSLLMSFLNLTAVSLILATFTSRFVFPMVSLEGHQLWLLGLLPLPRGRILWAKFAYSAMITLLAGLVVTTLSIRALDLPIGPAVAQLAVVASVCIGLCGAAVGFGATWPLFGQRNAARIASGFGGTINLILSVILVVIALAGTAVAGIKSRMPDGELDWRKAGLFLAAVVVFNLAAAFAAMALGIRRFRRMEF